MQEINLEKIKAHFINHALTFGEHSPGKSSRMMVDTREALLNGGILSEVGQILWDKIKKYNPSVIYGRGYGAINVMLAIQIAAEYQGVLLKTLIGRETRKDRNRYRLVEGPRPGDNERAVYVDDLMNTGSSWRKTHQCLTEEGININTVAAAVVFDFWTFRGSRRLEAQGIPVERLFLRHDLGDTRQDPLDKPVVDDVIWRNLAHNQWTNDWNKTAPLIYQDKVFYGNDRHQVFCHNIDTGEINWVYYGHKPTQEKGLGAMFSTDGQFLYFGSYDGTVCKININSGELAWKKHVDMYIHSTPHIDAQRNQLYIATEGGLQNKRGDIVCLDLTTGKTLWSYPTKHVMPAAPNLIHDQVICGSNDGNLYSVNPDNGSLNWIIENIGEIKGKPNYIDDVILACTQEGKLYGIDLNGNILWKRSCGTRSYHQYLPVHRKFGLTYVVNIDAMCIAYNKHGEQVWLRKLRHDGGWNITLKDNELIVVTAHGHIAMLDPLTGEKIRSNHLNYRVKTPVDFNDNYVAINSVPKGFYLYRRKND